MANKRTFQGMSYRELQQSNSQHRALLPKANRQWLKENGYRNTGWANVISLYQKIEELLDRLTDEDSSTTLGDLFLEADRIGNQYLTPQEIESFNQKLAIAVAGVAEEIDRQFPQGEAIEVIDFSSKKSFRSSKRLKEK